MISCGITCPSEINTAERINEDPGAFVSSPNSLASRHAEESCDVDCKLSKNDNNEESDCYMVSSKRCKFDDGNDSYGKIEATQSSIVKFLASYDNGVSGSLFHYIFLIQILEKCFCQVIFLYDIIAAAAADCLA